MSKTALATPEEPRDKDARLTYGQARNILIDLGVILD